MILTETKNEAVKIAPKIKIFEPLSNIHWLEEVVNLWLSENPVEVLQIQMNYSEDKYIITLLYKEND
jgi:hypothetical protein